MKNLYRLLLIAITICSTSYSFAATNLTGEEGIQQDAMVIPSPYQDSLVTLEMPNVDDVTKPSTPPPQPPRNPGGDTTAANYLFFKNIPAPQLVQYCANLN